MDQVLFKLEQFLDFVNDEEGWCCYKHTPSPEQIRIIVQKIKKFRAHREQACACRHPAAKEIVDIYERIYYI